MPNQVGVPTAPKDTGMVFMISAKTATGTAGKPRPIRMGAASAAGVPKPLAPSIMNENAQPTIINWATGLALTPLSQSLTTRIAPECSIVLNRKIAPQMIRMGVSAVSNPLTTVALTKLAFCSK